MASFTQLPSGSWRAMVKKKGHKTLTKTFRVKSLAKTWATNIEDQRALGAIVGEMVSPNITVCNLIDKYEREVATRKKGYRTSEKSTIKRIRAHFEGVDLFTLSVQRVISFVDVRLKTVSSDSVKRELSVLSSAWETAKILWDYPLKDNPVKKANKLLTSTNTYSKKVTRDRRPTREELIKLIAELSDTMADLMVFAIETAMRRSEISRIDATGRSDGGLRITDDKAGRTTIIPLSPIAEEILNRYPNGFGREPDSITQAFNRAKRRANIADLRFHDLRHEAASRLFERGLAIQEVAAITRHSDWRSLKGYTHPSIDAIRRKL